MHKRQISDPLQEYMPIENYAIIGDLYSVALVGTNGSIDWCCLPKFDSPSIFGALLDARKGGFFCIAPLAEPEMDRKQMYLTGTNILVTRFLTYHGVGEITDFMPIKSLRGDHSRHDLMRSVHVVHGVLTFEMICLPAFNYARDQHTLHLMDHGAQFLSPSFSLALSASVPLSATDQAGVRTTFTLRTGETAYFLLEGSHQKNIFPRAFSQKNYDECFMETKKYWRNWLLQCSYKGRWREVVERSALTLKLLTYEPTGAIVAAPTTSLPEHLHGERNWDYRYTWLRDSAFTLDSLLMLGFTQEAEAFTRWLNKRVQELKEGAPLQPMYSIDGHHELTEETLDHLEGYQKSRPVRIGNGAYTQLQLDVFGELIDAIYIYNRYKPIAYDNWLQLIRKIDWLSRNWHHKDEGIWEVRGGPQHFVHSRVMSWVAFDRAIRIANERGLPAPIDAWMKIRGRIYQEVMEKGWNSGRRSFVQYYGSDAIDASALFISLTGFTSPTDPRMLSTIHCIQRELTRSPHVYRYDIDRAADDGMAGKEGTFNICSFWLVDALARAGFVEESNLALEQLLTYANHVGLYAEEIGISGEALGNFPQAFTHLSLISACYHVDEALEKIKHLSM